MDLFLQNHRLESVTVYIHYKFVDSKIAVQRCQWGRVFVANCEVLVAGTSAWDRWLSEELGFKEIGQEMDPQFLSNSECDIVDIFVHAFA